MKAIHTLKDGTVVEDITGHVVRYEDCPEFYDCILRIYNRRLAEQQQKKEKTKEE